MKISIVKPVKSLIALTVAVMAFVASCKSNEEAPTLSVTPSVSDIVFATNGVDATADDGSPISPIFTVVTNQKEWDIEVGKPWVRIISKSKNQFTLGADVNSSDVSPEATAVIVTAGNATPVTIGVQQSAALLLTVAPEYRNIVYSFDGTVATSGGETITPVFTVKTNAEKWEAVSDQSWLIVDMQDKTFTLSATVVADQYLYEDATVTVTAEGTPSVEISVTRETGTGTGTEPEPEANLYGYIMDTDGKPIAGVVVSDGFQCVATDARGIYQMDRTNGAKFVFYATPSEYRINTASPSVNAAVFYTALDPNNKRYDFTLTKLPAVETEFNLLCIADPQVASASNVLRYQNETVADFRSLVNASAKPAYGLVLGDLTSDHPEFLTQVRTLTGSTGMKYFATIGNHDKTGGNATTPRNADTYCAVHGPLDYSFNRGNVHFVCLDDVIFTNNSTYSGGFENHQIEWLKQDLSFVPKDRLIIVFYHIPIRNLSTVKNRTALLNVLRDFGKVHLMCGHTHYNENFIITSPMTVYEHIHGAACGVWWHSNINSDGAPNGYAIYEVKGTELTNWYYKPTRYDKSFQIRLHRGNTQFGGSYGTFSYNQGNNIVANIWNADADWTIEAYEDGVHAGNLTKLSQRIDAFAAGYHVGVLNRNPDNYGGSGSGNNKHAYLHTLKNPNAQVIEIRATDKFGNVYTQSEIISSLTSAGTYP